MTDREKLVELLSGAWHKCTSVICTECKYYDPNAKAADRTCQGKLFADHILANVVTVQETGHWVSLTDCSNAGVYCSVCHKKVYKEDYAWCNRKNKLSSDDCPNCGAKIMPQPPKGE